MYKEYQIDDPIKFKGMIEALKSENVLLKEETSTKDQLVEAVHFKLERKESEMKALQLFVKLSVTKSLKWINANLNSNSFKNKS